MYSYNNDRNTAFISYEYEDDLLVEDSVRIRIDANESYLDIYELIKDIMKSDEQHAYEFGYYIMREGFDDIVEEV